MASLNSIAENIAYSLGQQFNNTLKESIKDSIVDHRAMLIRQDLENNPLSYTDYLTSFCMKLEEVNRSQCPDLPSNCTLLQTKEVLPKPLRIKNNGRVNLKFVGTADRKYTFTFETLQALQYMEYLPFQSNVVYYTIINNRVLILNRDVLCKVLIEEVVADPRKISDCDYPDRFPDDIEIDIPTDMLVTIKRLVRQGYPEYLTDGKEVNIEKDARD